MIKYKNGRVIFFITCLIIVILVSVIISLIIHNNSNERNVKGENETSSKITFNEKEQKIVDAIYKEPKVLNRFKKDDLKTLEVLNIKSSGYYKSKPDIRYIEVDYVFSCNDGTYDCTYQKGISEADLEEHGCFTLWIAIDMNNYSIVDVMRGISISANSDWIKTESKIN